LVNIVVALSGSDWKLDRYRNGCSARFLTPLLSRLGMEFAVCEQRRDEMLEIHYGDKVHCQLTCVG
jgi:hypothetical protein